MRTPFSIFYFTLAIVTLLLSSCDDNGSGPIPFRTPPGVLARQDLVNLRQLASTGGERFDAQFRGAYSSIFGGTRGTDVGHYFDERIHHLVSSQSSVQVFPKHFRYSSWTKDPRGEVTGIQPLPSPRPDVQLGAANIGTGLWLMGLINAVPVTLVVDDEPIAVASPRTGVMYLGPGYKEWASVQGREISLPSAYRQAILVHEARHSDCTGGITSEGLQVARDSRNQREFTERFPTPGCGHLHVYCPAGHELAGIAACDREAWGAYSISGVYARAALSRTDLTPLQWEVLNATSLDSFSRLLDVDPKAMLHGDYGAPDMSSETP